MFLSWMFLIDSASHLIDFVFSCSLKQSIHSWEKLERKNNDQMSVAFCKGASSSSKITAWTTSVWQSGKNVANSQNNLKVTSVWPILASWLGSIFAQAILNCYGYSGRDNTITGAFTSLSYDVFCFCQSWTQNWKIQLFRFYSQCGEVVFTSGTW